MNQELDINEDPLVVDIHLPNFSFDSSHPEKETNSISTKI